MEGKQREPIETYFDKYQRCVICDMVEQEHQDKERIFCENDNFVAICPFPSTILSPAM